MKKAKVIILSLFLGASSSVLAERLATVLEIDDNSLSAKELASTIDPRNIKAVKQHTLLADGLFHFNKDTIINLTHNSAVFRQLADEARSHGYTVRVDAFADEIGKDNYNQNLSQRRAKNVAKYLEQYGVPANQIVYQGWGEHYPIVNCKITPKLMKDKISKQQVIDCLAPNRRVTISLLN